jgi:secreted PhoX family phosphatase
MAAPAQAGASPYGPLGAADANGIRLPAGFTSRVIGTSGLPVAGTAYVWHPAPDGGATFPTPDGGWIYACNSEVPGIGGVGAVRFNASGAIVGAHRVLLGTSMNCAGGPTPWGTWLSCEEHDWGHVWECDPTCLNVGTIRPALGTFSHEAAAVDLARNQIYLTEDKEDGRFYRFTSAKRLPDMSAGTLEVAKVGAGNVVTWLKVPNPNPIYPVGTPTRSQVPQSTAFNGGEGCFFHQDVIYFTTKGDNRVWAYNCATSVLEIVYDDNLAGTPVLRGVDNVVVRRNGDVLVAEDGDDMNICMIRAGVVFPILQVTGHASSEISGPAFDPSERRLYFSSQRGPAPAGPGITYEVAGPF